MGSEKFSASKLCPLQIIQTAHNANRLLEKRYYVDISVTQHCACRMLPVWMWVDIDDDFNIIVILFFSLKKQFQGEEHYVLHLEQVDPSALCAMQLAVDNTNDFLSSSFRFNTNC